MYLLAPESKNNTDEFPLFIFVNPPESGRDETPDQTPSQQPPAESLDIQNRNGEPREETNAHPGEACPEDHGEDRDPEHPPDYYTGNHASLYATSYTGNRAGNYASGQAVSYGDDRADSSTSYKAGYYTGPQAAYRLWKDFATYRDDMNRAYARIGTDSMDFRQKIRSSLTTDNTNTRPNFLRYITTLDGSASAQMNRESLERSKSFEDDDCWIHSSASPYTMPGTVTYCHSP
ncbi:hypothetical protein GGR58DRAFT_503372 [Xylaria digitata]|nr:hypothetical protein GGR58DRAFT_503372 [Xylaria digitata]